ncbi:hypothetical protein GCM10023081_42510 [Arthrobacter ginkgonis]|uniref:Uncharacterized protein n=2 Tax=Arthrobacter ginkgonis TaxID=1630594 RepID=A0ABP7DAC7_9MICC
MLAIVALTAVVVSACLTSGARQVPHPMAFPQAVHHSAATHAESVERVDGPGQVAATAQPAAAAKHQCPDQGPPVPACHNQADLQLTTPAAGPRPDADLLWDHPRYAAERAGLPGSPFADPAPDLIALSISRT